MTENEVASSEMFAETLIVQSILEKSSLAKEQETNRIPENEFFQVYYSKSCLTFDLKYEVVISFCSSCSMRRQINLHSVTKLEI